MKKPALNTAPIQKTVKKLSSFVSKYKGTLIFAAFGLVVGLSFYRAQTYSDPARNEAHYQEQLQQSTTIDIDNELLDKIKASVDDDDTSVNQSTQPGRTNPFSE